MVNGYWKWLIGGLTKFGLAFLRLVPKVIFEVIPGIFKAGFGFIKKEMIAALTDILSWDNIGAGIGSICLMGLIFWVLALAMGEIKSLTMFWWGLGEIGLFLISTYAYWRGKP